MKDCLVRDWSVVCLLLFCTAVHCSHAQRGSCNATTNGSIYVSSLHVSVAEHENFTQGLIYICDGTSWRVVCDTNWDINDARVVCRELGFPVEVAQFCGDSCFFHDYSLPGATNFMCRGSETRLSMCKYSQPTHGGCSSSAGVICVNYTTPPTTSCPQCPNTSDCSTTPPNSVVTTPSTSCDCMDTPSTTPTTTRSPTHSPPTNSEDNTEGSEVTTSTIVASVIASCTGNLAITAALGAVSALLLLALVGVVTGWVWSCHRNKRTAKQRAVPNNMNPNPSYRSTILKQQKQQQQQQQAVYYSVAGPRDTPTGHTSLQEGEGAYFMIGKEDMPTGHASAQQGEDVYHMIGDMEEGEGAGEKEGEGMAYEVPLQRRSQGREKNAGMAVEMAYSKLHHN